MFLKLKLFEGKVELTEGGYVKAGEDTKTSVEGVYVAGDCRQKEIRQVVTAVCDGAVAAITAENILLRNLNKILKNKKRRQRQC